MKSLKLNNQILTNIREDAKRKWFQTTLRNIDPENFVTYCVLKSVEAEAQRQGIQLELDLPPRFIVEPDDDI